jgi:ribose 5-phosphate isomerase A
MGPPRGAGPGLGCGMDADALKQMAAESALSFVREGQVLGVGTGSTTNHFIDLLGARFAGRLAGAVPSSEASAERLRRHGFAILSLADAEMLPLYVDGADEMDPRLNLIKGGGGALTREKIVATAAATFVCIVAESKRVDRLGRFPLPVEVIPLAEPLVARKLRALGGTPTRRAGWRTDNGNLILDVVGLDLADPAALELELDAFPGVATPGGVVRLDRPTP